MADTLTRTQLKKFFKKYSSPTVEQWHSVLDSVLNIADDLPLDVEKIKTLKDTIDEIKTKLDNQDINSETKKIIDELKEAIKTKAESGDYVKHLTVLNDDDDNEVGTIAQYIGVTDEDHDLIRGFFYEKRNKKNSGTKTVDGSKFTLSGSLWRYNIEDDVFVGAWKIDTERLNNNSFVGVSNSLGDVVLAVNVDSLRDEIESKEIFDFGGKNYFPFLALDAQSKEIDFQIKENSVYVNGSRCTEISGVYSTVIYRQEDYRAFIALECEKKNTANFTILIPAFLDETKAYTIEFLDDNMIKCMNNNKEILNSTKKEITPKYYTADGGGVGWEIIQTSPSMM